MRVRLEAPSKSGGKFWEVSVDGKDLEVWFGAKSSSGQRRSRDFMSHAAAKKEAMKMKNLKLKKGYHLVSEQDSDDDSDDDEREMPKKPPSKKRKKNATDCFSSSSSSSSSASSEKLKVSDDSPSAEITESKSQRRRKKPSAKSESGERISEEECMESALTCYLNSNGDGSSSSSSSSNSTSSKLNRVILINEKNDKFVAVLISADKPRSYCCVFGEINGGRKIRSANKDFEGKKDCLKAALTYLKTKIRREYFERMTNDKGECESKLRFGKVYRKIVKKIQPLLKKHLGNDVIIDEELGQSNDESDDNDGHLEYSSLFDGYEICITGALSDTQSAVRKFCQDHGFKVSTSLTKNCEYMIIGNYVKPRSEKCKQAEMRGIPIVRESWIRDSVEQKTVLNFKDYLASVTASKSAASKSSSSSPTKSGSSSSSSSKSGSVSMMKSMKMKKGQAPVDEHFFGKCKNKTLDPSNVSIFKSTKNGRIWDATLNQTNIIQNNNKYYKLQLILCDHTLEYYVWFRWGRIGYTNGTTCTGPFEGSDGLKKAQKIFEKKFSDKTGNHWGDSSYDSLAGKYTYIPMDYSGPSSENDDEEQKQEVSVDLDQTSTTKKTTIVDSSKLDQRLQDFLQLIFDTGMMEAEMREIGFDLDRLPLGKLKQNIIDEAYEILGVIAEKLGLNAKNSAMDTISQSESEGSNTSSSSTKTSAVVVGKRSSKRQLAMKSAAKKKSSLSEINHLSSNYYTLIPHDFGFKVPPPISNERMLEKELELIETLSNIEICTRIVKEDSSQNSNSKNDGSSCSLPMMNPLDLHYQQLNAEIIPLSEQSKEYEIIADYVRLGHGPTHTDYTCRTRAIYSVNRMSEEDRFQPYECEKNRMLLWHGSAMSNFVGIIKNGLKIKPSGVAHVGSMFGNGIYFADVCTKSVNYCHSSKSHPIAVALLSEVALGKMEDKEQASVKRKKDTNSVRGLGAMIPNKKTWKNLDNGCIVPVGECVLADEGVSDMDQVSADGKLRYNEYIVYDTSRVRMRYLVVLDLDYKLTEW